MIKLNDVTNRLATDFGDLKVGDYFIQNPLVIWMKTDEFNKQNAIQITNNDDYLRYGFFTNDSIVEKINIVSIDYRRINNDKSE